MFVSSTPFLDVVAGGVEVEGCDCELSVGVLEDEVSGTLEDSLGVSTTLLELEISLLELTGASELE